MFKILVMGYQKGNHVIIFEISILMCDNKQNICHDKFFYYVDFNVFLTL